MIQTDLPRLFINQWNLENHEPSEIISNIIRPEFNDAMQKLEARMNNVDPVVVAFSATPTFDLSEIQASGTAFILAAMSANVTGITIQNATIGQIWTVVFSQDAVGGWVVSGWPSNVRLAGATFVATPTALAVSTLTFLYTGTVHLEIARTLDV